MAEPLSLMIEDIRISELTREDVPAVQLLQPAHWRDISPSLLFYLQSDFCYPVKVTAGHEVVGCGAAIVHGNVTWLAHIITDERHRGKGIGTVITRHLVDFGLQRTPTINLIATRLGQRVYARQGFRAGEEYTVFASRAWTGPVDQHIMPYEKRFEEQVLRIDREATGEIRPALLSEKWKDAMVYVKNDRVLGYSIPSYGEGPVFASDPEAGIALMKTTMQADRRLVIPDANREAIGFLKREGFGQEDFFAVRMQLGQPLGWKPEHVFGRIGGNLG